MVRTPLRAFTVVELLVVITIIVILLALLTPALDKAIEAAERVRCAANLDAWGLGLAQHSLDNRNKILAAPSHMWASSFNTDGGGWTYPNHPRFRKTQGAEAGQISLDEVAPYVQGHNTSGQAAYVGKLWYCPSSLDNFWYRGAHDNANNGTLVVAGVDVSFMFNDYAYFGHGSTAYRNYATHPEKLIGNRLEGGKLLMADTIYRWNSGNGQWWFNHSEVGYSVHDRFGGGDPVFSGNPPLTGTNQLFGDGSVTWKDEKQFDPVGMNARRLNDPKVSFLSESPGPGTGGSMNFY